MFLTYLPVFLFGVRITYILHIFKIHIWYASITRYASHIEVTMALNAHSMATLFLSWIFFYPPQCVVQVKPKCIARSTVTTV